MCPFETDNESKNGLDTGSTETVSRYSTTLNTVNLVYFGFNSALIYCSMLNWMIYFRGHSSDFDEWEELGNPGWGWDDVLPFFKSAERWDGPNSDGVYGTEGRFNIMPNPFIYRVRKSSLGSK